MSSLLSARVLAQRTKKRFLHSYSMRFLVFTRSLFNRTHVISPVYTSCYPIHTSAPSRQIRVEDHDHYVTHEAKDYSDSATSVKSPHIPEGHPIDTDGRPLGLIIPDYDVELPALSFGGYAKDFQAFEDAPPVFPPTSWPKLARYDEQELETKALPKTYEVNVLACFYVLAAIGLSWSVIGTRWETGNYYKRNGSFYKTGWPCFHYEPNLDIVPLTQRKDGLPPETLILSFVNRGDVWHELPPADMEDSEDSEEGDEEDETEGGDDLGEEESDSGGEAEDTSEDLGDTDETDSGSDEPADPEAPDAITFEEAGTDDEELSD